MGKFQDLFRGLRRTRENLSDAIQELGGRREVDESTLDDLEAALLTADLGPGLASTAIDEVRARARRGDLPEDGLAGALRHCLVTMLGGSDPEPAARADRPHVVFVVGVNGGGKTTTVGKLAARERGRGRKVVVVAADTFRAAAIDQLERWAERAGVEVVKQKEGADPASVVYDALGAARARRVDTVIVDTAGRLHTKTNLMAELDKIRRVADRVLPGAPDEVLLVVDATTGQNGLAQAKEFTRAAHLTGVVLTKLDGTAKGGVALAIRHELGVPVRFVGVGERPEDLLEFDPAAYVDGLLGIEERA